MTTLSLTNLKNKKSIRVTIDQTEILAVWIKNEVKIYNGICPHLGGPLLDAKIKNGVIKCPWHHYEWNLHSGESLTIPGKVWELAEGYERPNKPFSRNLSPVNFVIDEDIITLKI